MRIFESFDATNGHVCPLCKTSEDLPTVLLPVPMTDDGHGNSVAVQVHKACYDQLLKEAHREHEF